ncbi:hypothetical protein BKA93DRAFT_593521 [Sparassis latifolia]
MTEQINFSLSQLSLQSTGSAGEEDWDRSMQLQSEPELDRRTPRNSVVFPGNTDNSGEGDTGDAPGRTHGQSTGGGKPKRTLSELLRLHAANGPDGTFSPEEANRVAEVLGQWINSSSSPYESEDDFFTPHSILTFDHEAKVQALPVNHDRDAKAPVVSSSDPSNHPRLSSCWPPDIYIPSNVATIYDVSRRYDLS